ncbi:MAG: tRNA preQ1(34) S-adenosylmethionine ribosyltransferase-isomerase QueA [Blastopirellula sp.]|nr:MAG: tRNA preQ1(34) S-adenosylmethionine ribosyltransferase-isomerase QueA [Blastopirellula sp.]
MTRIDTYDYTLPKELIAQQPLKKRPDARLLVVNRTAQSIEHRHIRDLPEILRPTDHLISNDTRVVPARIVGKRTDTGGRWQGLYLESDSDGNWKILSKTRGKLTPGETVTLQDREANNDVKLKLLIKLDNGMWIAKPESMEGPLDILERVGRIPLPHYIRDGEMLPDDWVDYQTVFARQPGAVAAPTAGLHFTKTLLAELEALGIQRDSVTLHVGIGTFKPVAVETLEEHNMHTEWGDLSESVANKIQATKAAGGRIISVGTTSARVLETAAKDGSIAAWQGDTNLFIRPGFEFHAIDGLLTNFHLPKSTLLVLVRTFGGDDLIKEAYQEAIREEYRFFSYGDAMLIL